MRDSELIEHRACPSAECGSSDAFAVYDDGHGWCYSCGHFEPGESGRSSPAPRTKTPSNLIQGGEVQRLKTREITAETCAHFGYVKVDYKGQSCFVAPYYNGEGQLVAQKLRLASKDFKWRGDSKAIDVLPFGSHCFPHSGKKLIVTEGEIDALAMSQVQNNRWPTVSIPTGATPKTVRRYFARHMDYFEGFDEVVLMFDMDEIGRAATQQAAEVLGSRAKIATLAMKDPSDMLKAGKVQDLLAAMWGAKTYRPEGIVDLASLKEDVLRPIEKGLSWPFETLTELTYGIRLGEIYALGAGTGVGKTDFFTQTMAHLMKEHDQKIGVFALEQEPKETGLRVMGKLAEKPFHIPDAGWVKDDLAAAWDEYAKDGTMFLYDSFGINDWDAVKSKIRYLRDAEGVQYFFLDHLTALAAWQDDERVALEKIMAELGGLVKEIPIALFFISHLATPDGKPHEEGGRVMIRHFKGSRSIGFWSHFMFGLERDQQNSNHKIRTTTTFRVLKDRYTGRSTGQVFYLGYDQETGYLFETTPPDETAESFGFDADDDSGGPDTGADF